MEVKYGGRFGKEIQWTPSEAQRFMQNVGKIRVHNDKNNSLSVILADIPLYLRLNTLGNMWEWHWGNYGPFEDGKECTKKWLKAVRKRLQRKGQDLNAG